MNLQYQFSHTAIAVRVWLGNYIHGNVCDVILIKMCTMHINSGLILGLHQASERRRYKATPAPIGWTQT